MLNSDSHALIHFIVWYASRSGGGISRIRLIKFLYLADVHAFRQNQRQVTPYHWRFYHYGPWTSEAQVDIDTCLREGLIQAAPLATSDEGGEILLYRASGPDPHVHTRLGASLDVLLRSEIDRWKFTPLNLFLNYVYFDTPPMRDARRGDPLRFDPEVFGSELRVEEPRKRYSTRKAREAFGRLLNKSQVSQDRVPVPHDAIIDEAFLVAMDSLDAQDHVGPLSGSVDVDPDALQ